MQASRPDNPFARYLENGQAINNDSSENDPKHSLTTPLKYFTIFPLNYITIID